MRDFDRLQTAFNALNKQGIITHHNYWCCGGCASALITRNYDALPPEKQAEMTGVVFYHEQDAELAINHKLLMLRYDALPYGVDGAQKAVGDKVAQALRDAGLTVAWDGTPRYSIEVTSFEVTLDEVPEGEGNNLHDRHDEDDDYDERPDEPDWKEPDWDDDEEE